MLRTLVLLALAAIATSFSPGFMLNPCRTGRSAISMNEDSAAQRPQRRPNNPSTPTKVASPPFFMAGSERPDDVSISCYFDGTNWICASDSDIKFGNGDDSY